MERPSFWGVFSEARDITTVILAFLLFVFTVIGVCIAIVVGGVHGCVFVYNFVHITLGAPVALAYIISGSTMVIMFVFILNVCLYFRELSRWLLYVIHKKSKKHSHGERAKFEVIDFIEDKEAVRKPWDKWFK